MPDAARLTGLSRHVIRIWDANLPKPFGGSDGAPALIVARPAAQLDDDELGAFLLGAVAANLGWQVTNLGH